MLVNTQADGLLLEVIHLIQVTKYDISNEEEATGRALKLVLMKSELALVTLCLMKVLFWWELDGLTTYLEGQGLKFWSN